MMSECTVASLVMSDHFQKLSNEMKQRYMEKISVINYKDPYKFKETDFLTYVPDFPKININHIVIYYAFTHSFYTNNQLKAVKSLDAYLYLEANFVSDLGCVKVNENFVVLAKVKHGQKMNDKPLESWLIFLEDGSISSAHCTCMAGLGEACSHTAAIAFKLLFASEEESCTQKLCVWNVPKMILKIEPKELKDVYLGKQTTSYDDIYTDEIVPLTSEQWDSFYQKLNPKAAILIFKSETSKVDSTTGKKNLPPFLTDLYNFDYEKLKLDDLRKIPVNIAVTEEQADKVFCETFGQASKSNWYRFRAGRITASNFQSACVTTVIKPSLTTVKKICYPVKIPNKIKAIEWGKKHEEDGLNKFKEIMSLEGHQNVKITPSGLLISLENPIFAASPDGLVSCDCCGNGSIEIKCPYKIQELKMTMKDRAESKHSYLVKNEKGIYTVDQNHQYYFQIQLQMFCLETEHCYFVVWSPKECAVFRVNKDPMFLSDNIAKASLFHRQVIVPELLGRYYSKLKASVLLVESSESHQNELQNENQEKYENF